MDLETTCADDPYPEVERLKGELARCHHNNKALQEKLEAAVTNTTSTSAAIVTCEFVDKLPAEVRLQIYENLLVNPLLGTKESAEWNACFELSPNILRTCRKVYNEARPILYEKNTFWHQCSTGEWERNDHCGCKYERQICCCERRHTSKYYDEICELYQPQPLDLSPLTRHWNNGLVRNSFMTLEHLSAFKLVQNWRVVVRPLTNAGYNSYQNWNSTSWCNVVCQSSPRSIEVVIVTEGGVPAIAGSHANFEECLEPFRLLRNVEKLTFRVAEDDDTWLPEDHVVGEEAKSYMPSQELQREIRQIATGNSLLELVRPMYDRLLRYAQSFERFYIFRLRMEIHGSATIIDNFGPEYDEHHWVERQTPYPYADHPVEVGLWAARSTITSNNCTEFKSERNSILMYLEEQYRVIVKARADLLEFIHLEKVEGGLFDTREYREWALMCHFSDDRHKYSECLLFLEDYTKSFHRQMPFRSRAIINGHKRQFDGIYRSKDREQAITNLHEILEFGNNLQFINTFKTVLIDLEKQYMDIRTTRQALFTADLEDAELCVDEEFEREIPGCEVGVDWTVNGYRYHGYGSGGYGSERWS